MTGGGQEGLDRGAAAPRRALASPSALSCWTMATPPHTQGKEIKPQTNGILRTPPGGPNGAHRAGPRPQCARRSGLWLCLALPTALEGDEPPCGSHWMDSIWSSPQSAPKVTHTSGKAQVGLGTRAPPQEASLGPGGLGWMSTFTRPGAKARWRGRAWGQHVLASAP